jgi:N-acetylmuramoyl-L-alanine amidase
VGKFTKQAIGARRRRTAIAAAMVGVLLLPIEASDAGWLSDVFKGSSKAASSPHDAPSPERRSAKHAAAKPAVSKPSASRPISATCDPAKFRIIVDVGHTEKSEGANSARNVPEFSYNLRLARRIAEKLKAQGFAGTKLLITEGGARPSLVKRVNVANDLPADFFLSIHHDSVPDKLLEDWEFEGKQSHFSDRFSGYSVWVSHENPEFKTSLAFAELLAKEMKARGLNYAHQYTDPIMGHYQHQILNRETGVYAYDELIVLRKTRMPAVLLEAGSIINRDEELKMDSAERRDITSSGVVAAMKKFCDSRAAAHSEAAVTAPSQDHPAQGAAVPNPAVTSAKPEAKSR